MAGALVAWVVAGTGMLMLAFVFQNLAIRKPELDSGVFIYAKAGFGDYAGFNSAIGFWASSVAATAPSVTSGRYTERVDPVESAVDSQTAHPTAPERHIISERPLDPLIHGGRTAATTADGGPADGRGANRFAA